MSLGQQLIDFLEQRREKKTKSLAGPLGDFYRSGGNARLVDAPVRTGDIVIDVGGFKGDWTAKMLVRYGCRSEVYEPVPEFTDHCRQLFAHNSLVKVHAAGVGGSTRLTTFHMAQDGTSEFINPDNQSQTLTTQILDIAQIINELGADQIACLKLNIEGGEYEVLERLIETGQIARIRSLLIQFHRQPADYEARYQALQSQLAMTHTCEWRYLMVWEKWLLR